MKHRRARVSRPPKWELEDRTPFQKKTTGGSNFRFQIPIDGGPPRALRASWRGKSVPSPRSSANRTLPSHVSHKRLAVTEQLTEKSMKSIEDAERRPMSLDEDRRLIRMDLREALSRLVVAKAMRSSARAGK